MRRNALFITITAGLLVAAPGPGHRAWAAPASSRTGVAPLPMSAGAIRDLQGELSTNGFSPGKVDGLWGPDTAGALSRYQAANGLPATGRFDQATLAALRPAGVGPVPTSPHPLDQTTASGVPVMTTAPAPASAGPAIPASPSSMNGTLATGGTEQGKAASGASGPAHGANSFTDAEARRRIAGQGFQRVSELRKDGSGVWRGIATKDGQRVPVWLDYTGKVGQQ